MERLPTSTSRWRWLGLAGRCHELRLKRQWLDLVADQPIVYRLDAQGQLNRSQENDDAFTLSESGTLLRYRHAWEQRRELYVAYARGSAGPCP